MTGKIDDEARTSRIPAKVGADAGRPSKEPPAIRRREAIVDASVEDSFPASDPPSAHDIT
jgi:hypothetical protein